MREGWTISTLGDRCHIKPPKKEARDRLSANDMVSFVPMNNLGIREKGLKATEDRPLGSVSGSYAYFADGDVLLAKITPCFENGKLGIARGLTNGVGFGSSEFVVFRPDDSLDTEYLFYFLSQDSFRDAGASVMSGAVGHKRVPKEFIESCAIPLPPLPEQKRIVAILDEAFAGIATAVANTEKNLANARELFESYLSSVLSQRGEGWKVIKLGDKIDLLTGFAFKSKGYTSSPNGMALLRGDNIVPRSFRWENVKRWPADNTDEFKKYQLEEHDVVLAMDRTWIQAGIKYAQITKDDLPCLLVQRVARLRAGPNLRAAFLKYVIGSRPFSDYVLSIQTGVGVPHISGPQISSFEFPLPPIAMQDKFASELDSLLSDTSSLESIYQRKLTALAELKQSLLQKAFSGELTSPPSRAIKEAAE